MARHKHNWGLGFRISEFGFGISGLESTGCPLNWPSVSLIKQWYSREPLGHAGNSKGIVMKDLRRDYLVKCPEP